MLIKTIKGEWVDFKRVAMIRVELNESSARYVDERERYYDVIAVIYGKEYILESGKDYDELVNKVEDWLDESIV